jgi:hypothetical protein
MTTPSNRILPTLALAIALVVISGCANVGIGVTNAGDIKRAPAAFEGKEVTVKGTVSDVLKLPIVEVKSYSLADSTGEIRVTTRGAAPAKGEKLIVRGVVSSAAIVGGHSVGLHVSERERSSAF